MHGELSDDQEARLLIGIVVSILVSDTFAEFLAGLLEIRSQVAENVRQSDEYG